MRRFRDIVEDIKAPSPQSLWLDKGKLKFFGTKGWTLMAGEEGPDLSGYAKLRGINDFTGINTFDILAVSKLRSSENHGYLQTEIGDDRSDIKTYTTSGGLADIGPEESFVFTLEDGSKVTKSIRVLSTVNN